MLKHLSSHAPLYLSPSTHHRLQFCYSLRGRCYGRRILCYLPTKQTITADMMPPNPVLFTSDNVSSKTLKKRVDLWMEKTFYVFGRMHRDGYCRLRKPEALDLAERMSDRMSGLIVAYRHIADSHLITSYIRHITALSDVLIPTHHLLTSHDQLISDLYSRAAHLVQAMTPTNIAQCIFSYEVFRKSAKRITFKKDDTKANAPSAQYCEEMDHVKFITRMITRLKETLQFARVRDLIEILIGLHAIDAKLTPIADQLFDSVMGKVRVESMELDDVARTIYALGLWGIRSDTDRTALFATLLERIEASSDRDIKDLYSPNLGRMLLGFGLLRETSAESVVKKTQVWFDEYLNGFALGPRDLARCAYGYAFSGVFDLQLAFLFSRQSVRRSGFYNEEEVQMLQEAMLRMKISADVDFNSEVYTRETRLYDRISLPTE